MAWWSSSRAGRPRSWRRFPSRACGASVSARPPQLADYGVRTIGDLAALPDDLLARRFGKQGPVLAARARGIDPSPVSGAEPARSVSHEHTFDVDTSDPEVLERTLLALSEGVAGRLRAGHVRARTVAVKVRDCILRHRLPPAHACPSRRDETEVIFRAALELARPELRGIKVRLLGVAASHLEEGQQLALFHEADDRRRRATRGRRRDPASLRLPGHPPRPPHRQRRGRALRA